MARHDPFSDVARLIASDEVRRTLENLHRLARYRDDALNKTDESLLLWVLLAVQRIKPSRREDWEDCWARYTGKTWKQLTEFPDRLRKMADEVRHLSDSHYFDPARAITSEAPLAIYAKRVFPVLPRTLLNYADWLEAQVKSISSLMKSFYRRVPRKHSPFISCVSNEVKSITGRFCDREVADLLNVADRVLYPGAAAKADRFDEQLIALLRSRQKSKAPKT